MLRLQNCERVGRVVLEVVTKSWKMAFIQGSRTLTMTAAFDGVYDLKVVGSYSRPAFSQF